MQTLQKSIFSAVVLLLVLLTTQNQAVAQDTQKKEITVKFQNNSIIFRKVTLVSYYPSGSGNSTEGMVLAPYFSVSKTFEEGTKIYFASNKQIDVVMSGKKIEDKPFLIIKLEDAGKTFKIF